MEQTQQKNTVLGLLGVLGIWVTAGIALPLVNYFKLSPEQLMVARGFVSVLLAFILLRGKVLGVDRWTYIIALVVPFATLGLYKGIRAWGASPTIVIITATPIVNFLIRVFIGQNIAWSSVAGFFLMLGGITLARLEGTFQLAGFAWSVLGAVMAGITFEAFAKSSANSLQKCFWGMGGIGVLGLVLSTGDSWQVAVEPKVALALLGFAIVGGFLYWLSNAVAFTHLPVPEASVLAQGETPAVIVGAGFLLHEQTSYTEWLGVAIALFGATLITLFLIKQKR